jgi:hypothetical protein
MFDVKSAPPEELAEHVKHASDVRLNFYSRTALAELVTRAEAGAVAQEALRLAARSLSSICYVKMTPDEVYAMHIDKAMESLAEAKLGEARDE